MEQMRIQADRKFSIWEGMELIDKGDYAIIYVKGISCLLFYNELERGVPICLSVYPRVFATLCMNCQNTIKVSYHDAKFCTDSCKNQYHNNLRPTQYSFKQNTMKNELAPQVFYFNEHKVEVIMINEMPHWVAKDVCDSLSIANSRDAMTRLDEDEKLMSVVATSGQKREMWLINESGLYNLIFQSRKPEAKRFRKWVTSEVLPAIRKTGEYKVSKPTVSKEKELAQKCKEHEKAISALQTEIAHIKSKYNDIAYALKAVNNAALVVDDTRKYQITMLEKEVEKLKTEKQIQQEQAQKEKAIKQEHAAADYFSLLGYYEHHKRAFALTVAQTAQTYTTLKRNSKYLGYDVRTGTAKEGNLYHANVLRGCLGF